MTQCNSPEQIAGPASLVFRSQKSICASSALHYKSWEIFSSETWKGLKTNDQFGLIQVWSWSLIKYKTLPHHTSQAGRGCENFWKQMIGFPINKHHLRCVWLVCEPPSWWWPDVTINSASLSCLSCLLAGRPGRVLSGWRNGEKEGKQMINITIQANYY